MEQLVKEAAQLRAQIEMVTNQVRNLTALPSQMWSPVQGEVDQLIQIASQAQGVSYASQNIAGEFEQTYGPDVGQVPSDYVQTLQRWTADTNSQIQSTLTQYHLDAGA